MTLLRLSVFSGTPSPDGKYYPRYPAGNAPNRFWPSAATEGVSASGHFGVPAALAANPTESTAASAALSGGLPSITNTSLAAAVIGAPYSDQINVTGGSGTYIVWCDSAAPNHEVWHWCSPTGALGGTPQKAPLAGVETVTYFARDLGTGAVTSKTLTINVAGTGSLAVVTTSLPNGFSGGFYGQQIVVEGAHPPFKHNTGDLAQPWWLTPSGLVFGAPTSTTTQTFTDTITDATGASITHSFTINVSASAFKIQGVDSVKGTVSVPPSRVGRPFAWSPYFFGGTGVGQNWTVMSGTMPPGLSMSSTTGKIIGTPTGAGTYSWTTSCTDSGSNTASATFIQTVRLSDTAARPGYNTGTGYYVVGGKLYDPSGYEFRVRGVNRNHYDSAAWTGGANGAASGANTVREVMGFAGGQTPAQMVAQIENEYIANDIFPIVAVFAIATEFTGSITGTTLNVTAVDRTVSNTNSAIIAIGMGLGGAASGGKIISQLTSTAAGGALGLEGTYQLDSAQSGSGAMTGGIGNVSGFTDPNRIVSATNQIIYALANGLSALEAKGAINIANEWGPSDSTVWRDTYITAVAALRAAGCTCPILIDAGGSGQDIQDLINYAEAVQAADPQQNCVFAYHGYGSIDNTVCYISNITTGGDGSGHGSSTVKLNSSNSVHPFGPSYVNEGSNTYNGTTQYYVVGVQGMTGINGYQACSPNNLWGTGTGDWEVILSADVSGLGTYTGGGLLVPDNHFELVFASLGAPLRAQNVCVILGEFGPSTPPLSVWYDTSAVTFDEVIGACEANEIGWMYWAWDDNNLGGNVENWLGWFGMAGVSGSAYLNGEYAVGHPTTFTAYGQWVEYGSRCGLRALPSPSGDYLS